MRCRSRPAASAQGRRQVAPAAAAPGWSLNKRSCRQHEQCRPRQHDRQEAKPLLMQIGCKIGTKMISPTCRSPMITGWAEAMLGIRKRLTNQPGNPVGGQPDFGFVRGGVSFTVLDCVPCPNAFSESVERLLGVRRHGERSVEPFRHSPYQGRGILTFVLKLIGRKYPQGKNAEQQSCRDQRYRRQKKPKPQRKPFPHTTIPGI